jgi:hypothetical protein
VLLARRTAAALLAVRVDSTEARLDRQLSLQGGARRIPVADPGVLLNLNTDADWQAWTASR